MSVSTGHVKWFDKAKGFGFIEQKMERMFLYILVQFSLQVLEL